MIIRLYDAIYSLQKFLESELEISVDWIFDGYEYPEERPFITIETIADERMILAKQREAVQVIEHLQVGYHAENIVDRTKQAERISDLLTFKKVPYFDTDKSVDDSVGYFLCEVTAVTPIMAEEKNRESEYHRVYLDVDIEIIKRSC